MCDPITATIICSCITSGLIFLLTVGNHIVSYKIREQEALWRSKRCVREIDISNGGDLFMLINVWLMDERIQSMFKLESLTVMLNRPGGGVLPTSDEVHVIPTSYGDFIELRRIADGVGNTIKYIFSVEKDKYFWKSSNAEHIKNFAYFIKDLYKGANIKIIDPLVLPYANTNIVKINDSIPTFADDEIVQNSQKALARINNIN